MAINKKVVMGRLRSDYGVIKERLAFVFGASRENSDRSVFNVIALP